MNSKNIDSLFSKSMKMTKNDMLTYIDKNWTESPFISGSSIRHEPSDPGEFPAVQSEDLRKSMHGNSSKEGLSIYSTEKYSVYLEYGTKNIEPRPFFRPTLNRCFGFFKTNIKKLLK